MPVVSCCGVPDERNSGLRSFHLSSPNNNSSVVVDFGGAFLLWFFSSKKGLAGFPDRNVCSGFVMVDMEPLLFDHRRRYHSDTDRCDVWPEIFLDDAGYDFIVCCACDRPFRMGRLFIEIR